LWWKGSRGVSIRNFRRTGIDFRNAPASLPLMHIKWCHPEFFNNLILKYILKFNLLKNEGSQRLIPNSVLGFWPRHGVAIMIFLYVLRIYIHLVEKKSDLCIDGLQKFKNLLKRIIYEESEH